MRWFPVRESYRVTARFVTYPRPKMLAIPNILGSTYPTPSPGYALFKLNGQEFRLEPVIEDDEKELFFIFRDQTAGKETYGAGRFLYTELPRDGKVELDFNKAENPPCAFTPLCHLPSAAKAEYSARAHRSWRTRAGPGGACSTPTVALPESAAPPVCPARPSRRSGPRRTGSPLRTGRRSSNSAACVSSFGRHLVKRRALADAAGIVVVEIQIRLEGLQASRDLFAQRHAQIARIAHQQQRRHGAQRVAEPADAALLFGRREVGELRQKRGREMQPERGRVHLLLGHGEIARARRSPWCRT